MLTESKVLLPARRFLLLACLTVFSAGCALSLTEFSPRDGQMPVFPAELPDGMTFDATSGELIVSLPSVDLPPSLAYATGGVTATLATAVPFDAWLHGYRIEVVDAAGLPITDTTLHHFNVFAPDKRELFSPIMLHVVAAGMETGEVQLPSRIGYRLRRGERLLLVGMLHNPTGVARSDVTIRARLRVSAPTNRRSPISVQPFFISVTEPGDPAEFDVPVGRSTMHREYRLDVSGRILGVGGHLHQHGESLTLEDVTARKVIWRSRAVRDTEGNVIDIPRKSFAGGVRVKAGHVYRVTAVYNNNTTCSIADGAMGAIGGVFLPDAAASMPAADSTNPTYVKDFQMRFGPHALHGHRHGAQGSPAQIPPQ